MSPTFTRRPCVYLLLAATLALAALPQARPASAADAERPNIIYVMADDLGYGDLGCYGQQRIATPNLDQMAAEGLRMTDHYAGHTVCRPSRLVLWTGRHSASTGLIGNRPRNLSGQEATVAQRLKAAGYQTGGVGKWALGNVDRPAEIDNPGHPNHNGFDRWFGYMNQSNAHNYYPLFLWDNDRQITLPGNVLMEDPKARGRVAKQKVTYSHDVMTEAAFDFIRQHHQDPFLLHIHWTIPHANNEAGRVLGDGMEVPDYGDYADKDWPAPEKGFAAMISRMDRDMGRLLALLKQLEIDEKTIVFFTSDNGPHHEGGHRAEFFDSNGPLKGTKRSMHEGGIRVPMIVRWPGTIAAGRTSDHPSAFWDYLPTACELAGVEVAPAETDGISFVPTLLGRPDQQTEHDYLVWLTSEGSTCVGMRDGRWKLVAERGKGKRPGDGSPLPPIAGWRLYDLMNDPGETQDLSLQQEGRVDAMIARLRDDGILPAETP